MTQVISENKSLQNAPRRLLDAMERYFSGQGRDVYESKRYKQAGMTIVNPIITAQYHPQSDPTNISIYWGEKTNQVEDLNTLVVISFSLLREIPLEHGRWATSDPGTYHFFDKQLLLLDVYDGNEMAVFLVLPETLYIKDS